MSSGNRDFPSLEKNPPLCSSEERSMLLSEVSQHLIMLAKAFEGYSSPADLHTAKKWILDPFLYKFNELPDDDPMKGELIELRADQASQMRHDPKRLEGFWCHNIQSYHQPVKKALNVLLPFSTTYLCEYSARCCRSKLNTGRA